MMLCTYLRTADSRELTNVVNWIKVSLCLTSLENIEEIVTSWIKSILYLNHKRNGTIKAPLLNVPVSCHATITVYFEYEYVFLYV